jgi:hypothetical protein
MSDRGGFSESVLTILLISLIRPAREGVLCRASEGLPDRDQQLPLARMRH